MRVNVGLAKALGVDMSGTTAHAEPTVDQTNQTTTTTAAAKPNANSTAGAAIDVNAR